MNAFKPSTVAILLNAVCDMVDIKPVEDWSGARSVGIEEVKKLETTVFSVKVLRIHEDIYTNFMGREIIG